MQPVYSPSYDGISLDIVSHETDLALRIGQHVPTIGRGAQLDDRGRGARTDRIVVRTLGAGANQLETRGWLQSLAGSGAARRFVHPFDGSWLARLSAFTERVEGGSFHFSMTLVEDVPHTIRADGNRGAEATLQELSVAADAMEASTKELGELAALIPNARPWLSSLPEQEPGETAAALDSWRVSVRQAQAELRTRETAVAYEASRALASLAGLLEQYAMRHASAGRRFHVYTTRRARPLIVQLTRLYGARHARRIAAEVARLNSLDDILHIPAGTSLRLPRL